MVQVQKGPDGVWNYSEMIRIAPNGDVIREPAEETVELIVREHHTYGSAPAGDRVRVAKGELKDKSLLKACMTVEEMGEIEAAREKRRLAREAAKPKVGRLKAIVEAAFAGIPPRAVAKPEDSPPAPPSPTRGED